MTLTSAQRVLALAIAVGVPGVIAWLLRYSATAKRRKVLLNPRAIEEHVKSVTASPASEPANQLPRRAQTGDAYQLVVSTQGSVAELAPNPIVADHNAATLDISAVVEEATDQMHQGGGIAASKTNQAESGSKKRFLNLAKQLVVSAQPPHPAGTAALPAEAPIIAAPPEDSAVPDLFPSIEEETSHAYRASEPIAYTPRPSEAVCVRATLPTSIGEVDGSFESCDHIAACSAIDEEDHLLKRFSNADEDKNAQTDYPTTASFVEDISVEHASNDGTSQVLGAPSNAPGVLPALQDDSPMQLKPGERHPEDLASAIQTKPASLDARVSVAIKSPEDPRVKDVRHDDQMSPERTPSLNIHNAVLIALDVEALGEAQTSRDKHEGDGSDTTAKPANELGPFAAAAKQQRRYRPPVRDPSNIRPSPRRETARTRDRGYTVDVRVLFGKGGVCRVSLLPRRVEGMPPNLHLTGPGGPLEISEMQDGWYEEVVPLNLGDLLSQGIAWESAADDGRRYSWALGGREIYVLSAQPQLSGFLNTQRLTLNEKHVVLCLATKKNEVLAAIAETGSPVPTVLDSGGVPEHWVVLRDVVPRLSVKNSLNGDITDCLRPLPDAELSLQGGIRLAGNRWLAGFPPQIRVRGDHASVTSLFIDGHEAIVDATGAFITNGWNAIGEHSVAAAVGTRTYIIEGQQESWQPWAAHAWSLGEETAAEEFQHPSICGALVQAPRSTTSRGRAFVVPASNVILVGAVPGEIEICRSRRDVLNTHCVGFPNFEPVWALPADALRCDKRMTHVIHLNLGADTVKQQPISPTRHRPGNNRYDHARRAWSAAILAASHKGLAVNPHEQPVITLWRLYREHARAIARRRA